MNESISTHPSHTPPAKKDRMEKAVNKVLNDNSLYLRSSAKDLLNDIWKKICQTIELFPSDKGWDERHVYYAIKKIVECPEKTPEQILKEIKRSYLEHGKKWHVDGGGGGNR